MFDILTDVWSRPGAIHAPLLPLNISSMSACDADGIISDLHKHGFDTLLVYCEADAVIGEGVIEALFKACAKRFMLVFVHESVISCYSSCTDSAFTAYNPMMSSHKLTLVQGEAEASPFGEIVEKLWVKYADGKLLDVTKDITESQDASEYLLYTLVMDTTDGIDILCSETCEMLIYGAYETFFADHKESSAGTLVGVVSDRLLSYNNDTVFWSYDMLDDFKSVGGDLKMLVSMLMHGDKRSEKEGRRLYNKALSARLEKSFASPLSDWCGKKSLAFMGEAPLRFASNCGRRFTLPVWSKEGYSAGCDNEQDIISGVKFLGDLARGEGFTGAVYKAVSTDGDSLIRELNCAFVGSASLVILPEAFASSSQLDAASIGREDMRRICMRIKRLSTLGTSCGSKTPVAVLCDDDFIPYGGAEKLRSMGVSFNFVSRAQIMERGRTHHDELLIDKFRYSTLLVDQRIRLEPADVMKIGEFASYGGTMYRGGSFGDFAKKNLDIEPFMKASSQVLLVYETEKCSCPFVLLYNNTDSAVKISNNFRANASYILDVNKGKKLPLSYDSVLRVLPGEAVTLVFDPSSAMTADDEYVLSEILSLKEGENFLPITFSESSKAILELDSINGSFVDISVNGKTAPRMLYPPYSTDITDKLAGVGNILTLSSDNGFEGAVLRILSNEL